MICTECYSCSSICTCDNPSTEPAVFCENCGTICTEDMLDRCGFCEDCEEASLEYEEVAIQFLLDGVEVLLTNE
jgi:hypothetical protein